VLSYKISSYGSQSLLKPPTVLYSIAEMAYCVNVAIDNTHLPEKISDIVEIVPS
jgi:hypothetical protein